MVDKTIKYNNLKEMLNQTKERFGERTAFYLDGDKLENAVTKSIHKIDRTSNVIA